MSTVDLVSLRKVYGSTEVLHGIDVSISQGELLALVGPSGCGKSTLLRMIAGLESVTGGDIRFDGASVNDISPKRRNIAMVFQNYALYPHMTVRENISLNLRISRLPREEVRHRVEDAARLLEIEGILDRRPSQLSGGQRQRVAMGRAIVRNPSVFLFDEPLSNLDAKLRVQMRAEIKALHQKVRTTSIYVTHDQIEAMTLADRVAVMNAGRIEQLGTPMELYSAPANRFVGGFIGSPAMNFLPAVISGDLALLAGGKHSLPLPPGARVAEGDKVQIGLRPEHLRISETPRLLGIVRQIEPTGSQTHLGVEILDRQMIVVLEGMHSLQPGQPIGLDIQPQQIQIFSEETGETLRKPNQKIEGTAK